MRKIIFKLAGVMFVISGVLIVVMMLIADVLFPSWSVLVVAHSVPTPANGHSGYGRIYLRDVNRQLMIPRSTMPVLIDELVYPSPTQDYALLMTRALTIGNLLINLQRDEAVPFEIASPSIPRWSPDGQHFVYEGGRFVNDEFMRGLYVFSINDYAISTVIERRIETRIIYPVINDMQSLQWSPDSTQITVTINNEMGGSVVHIFDVATGELTPISSQNMITQASPWWGLDGEHVVFRQNDTPQNPVWYQYDIDTEEITPFEVETEDTNHLGQLIWSPTGTHGAYIDGRRLRIYDSIDDANPIEIDVLLGGDERVVWSPDGTELAVVNWRDNQVYLVGLDGTILRQVTNDGNFIYRLLD